jgi:hypothetical protein
MSAVRSKNGRDSKHRQPIPDGLELNYLQIVVPEVEHSGRGRRRERPSITKQLDIRIVKGSSPLLTYSL